MPRRVPGVDNRIPFICRAFIALFASSALGAPFAFRFNAGCWMFDVGCWVFGCCRHLSLIQPPLEGGPYLCGNLLDGNVCG